MTWQGIYDNTNGTLSIVGVGISSDTGVLKVDPATGDILLQGYDNGPFVDTGANLATLTAPIQVDAKTTINSNFVIDNGAGAFFEAPSNAFFPPGTPLINYTGSSARNPNSSLTIRGAQGVADTFEVALDTISNGGQNNTNGISKGEAGTVVLTEPPNNLNQQNKLIVTFGDLVTAPPAIATVPGVTGHLALDGGDPQGDDRLFVDDQGATISGIQPGLPSGGGQTDWTLNGNTIEGPQFPPLATAVPPVPPFAAGTVGDISYTNISSVRFNNNIGGDLLTINSVAAPTTASSAVNNYTVVNYNQPLAYPVNIVGVQNAPEGNLDIVGAPNGGNSIYVDTNSVALAAAGTKPQYGTPFTHLGNDLTYTEGSLASMSVAGNGGDNNITVQVPPTLIAPYVSNTLATKFMVYGGALPTPPLTQLAGIRPIAVRQGSTLLRVLGNAAGPQSTGADSISVSDLGGTGSSTAGATDIQMAPRIAGVVLYGEGGDDTLTNNSKITGGGLKPISALFIPGNGNATLTGGDGSDMFLGGDGQYTIVSKAANTPATPTTTYFFPHQNQFGQIYDPLLNAADGITTSMLTGTGGNQMVVTGAVDPALSIVVNPTTGSTVGDLDTGNLANPGLNGTTGGGTTTTGGQTISYPTVPPTNVTAPLYMVTDALTALEDAMGISQGPFPPNPAAVLEFGRGLNLRTQFAAPEAFVGRAYNDFLTDRGGGGSFGSSSGGSSLGGGAEGGAIVSQQEIAYWVSLLQSGRLDVQEMQAFLLASDELWQSNPTVDSWLFTIYEDVFGFNAFPTDQEINAARAALAPGSTLATRLPIALQLLTSPDGQTQEIQDAYSNVVPGASAFTQPSPADLAAIHADLVAGETLPQVAKVMGLSSGNYLAYEQANGIGTVGFISKVFQSVLDRPASGADLEYWATVRGAGLSDANIAQAVLGSAEAKSHVVVDTYQRYLNRSPDANDMNFWVSQLTHGLSDRQFVAFVVASSEYYADHGGSSPGYITGLYDDILRRTSPPAPRDVEYWATLMAASPRGAAQARADVALGFLLNPEYEGLLVNGWYQSFYGRPASTAEVQAAVLQFNAGASQDQVEAQILASQAAIS